MHNAINSDVVAIECDAAETILAELIEALRGEDSADQCKKNASRNGAYKFLVNSILHLRKRITPRGVMSILLLSKSDQMKFCYLRLIVN